MTAAALSRLALVLPDWPAPALVHGFVTTRAGGVSAGRHASLNLGLRSGDDLAAVLENRRRVRQLLPAEPRWLRQVHGTAVASADAPATAQAEPEADAAVARGADAVCAVMVADCMPVMFAAADGSVVGLAHAGWRGLSAGVLEATLERLQVPAVQVLAWLGPAIGPQAYEVGDEVRAAFLAADAGAGEAFRPTRPGHWLADLYLLARRRLALAGVERVYGGGFCTHGDRRFFSHRRDAPTGRMAAFLWRGGSPDIGWAAEEV